MLKNLMLAAMAFAAIAATQTVALAADEMGGTSYAGPDYRAQDASLSSAGLSYQPGAYYYGSDCGGNSRMGAAKAGPRKGVAAGVILGGAMASLIARDMNCDDRRQAMASYRDGLEGPIGRQYDWRNSNGGGWGNITALRQYTSGRFACRDFRMVTYSNTLATSGKGTACRQSDGNWHTL